ncbi:Uncharacterised protein [Mycobacteroides abscessus subsp. abscessus]|nr:Uncharacterised protein [Mycobacteroides abscessus subsp. abscessus]
MRSYVASKAAVAAEGYGLEDPGVVASLIHPLAASIAAHLATRALTRSCALVRDSSRGGTAVDLACRTRCAEAVNESTCVFVAQSNSP